MERVLLKKHVRTLVLHHASRGPVFSHFHFRRWNWKWSILLSREVEVKVIVPLPRKLPLFVYQGDQALFWVAAGVAKANFHYISQNSVQIFVDVACGGPRNRHVLGYDSLGYHTRPLHHWLTATAREFVVPRKACDPRSNEGPRWCGGCHLAYPGVSMLAHTYLAAHATSAAAEKGFSTAGS